MRVMSIASGSSGNCIYVGDDNTHILIDTGISKKRVEEGLKLLDLSIKDIDGILVTHEHSDHISGLGVVERAGATPVYATWGTLQGIKNTNLGKLPEGIFNTVECDIEFNIGTLKVKPVATSHDALCPCAFRVESDDKAFGLVTDLGVYDDYIVDSFSGVNCMLLEATHDIRMLETGPYPYPLKRRILGEKGHLSNEAAGQLVDRLLGDNVQEILLGHLSKENNYPELAYETVRTEIDMSFSEYHASDFKIEVAGRDKPSRIITL